MPVSQLILKVYIFNIGRVIWGNKYEKREERKEENVKENEGTKKVGRVKGKIGDKRVKEMQEMQT